jgi:hypothetical protein
MGLFHVKKGTPASKALPNKSTLKNRVSICMDFCCHEKKCNLTICYARTANIIPTGRMCPMRTN